MPEHHFHMPDMVGRIHRHMQLRLKTENPHYELRLIRRGQVLIPAKRVNEVPLLAQQNYIEVKGFRERPREQGNGGSAEA